jgi:hypothetical protein
VFSFPIQLYCPAILSNIYAQEHFILSFPRPHALTPSRTLVPAEAQSFIQNFYLLVLVLVGFRSYPSYIIMDQPTVTEGGLQIDPAVVITPPISEPWQVEKVVATIQPEAPTENSSSPVPFFHMLERLKTNKREGWRRFGIER